MGKVGRKAISHRWYDQKLVIYFAPYIVFGILLIIPSFSGTYFQSMVTKVFIFTIFGLVFIVLFPIFLISIFKIPQFKKGNLISSAHSIVTATIITATLGPALILSIKSDLVIFLFLMVCVIILILASFLGYYCTLKIKR